MKKKKEDETKPLTQEELKAWWPFTRLDPNRVPKKTKKPEPEKFEDALI